MIIKLGSSNPIKLQALKDVIKFYSIFEAPEVEAVNVSSSVSEQPSSLDETIQGAFSRAEAAHIECDLSVGIEGGLMQVKQVATGYMNVAACSIFDGAEHYLGLSTAFEHPPSAIEAVFADNIDISAAYLAEGLTSSAKIGLDEGAIVLLTNQRVSRKD